MIEYVFKCDKCKQERPKWMEFRWKDGTDSFICKECTNAFNKWLNAPIEDESTCETPSKFKYEYILDVVRHDRELTTRQIRHAVKVKYDLDLTNASTWGTLYWLEGKNMVEKVPNTRPVKWRTKM